MSTTKTKPKKEVTDRTKLNRLNKLLTYLRKLGREEPERFDLDSWIHSEDGFSIVTARNEWRQRYKNGEPLNCGTSACVAGHLPVIFPTSWEWRRNYVYYKTVPEQSEYEGMAEFFGGTPNQWQNVIYRDRYDDEKHQYICGGQRKIKLSSVIKRIEKIRDQFKETIK